MFMVTVQIFEGNGVMQYNTANIKILSADSMHRR